MGPEGNMEYVANDNLEEDPSEAYLPLVLAASRGQFDKVKLILEAGANIDMEAENDDLFWQHLVTVILRLFFTYWSKCFLDHTKKSTGELLWQHGRQGMKKL